MGAMCSGASLLENTARMQKAIIQNYERYQQEQQDGIETLPEAEEPKNIYAVYTLDGRMVRAPWQGTQNLPGGMYVINGKKVLIR